MMGIAEFRDSDSDYLGTADGPAGPEMAGGRGWEVEGPGGGLGEVWLWAGGGGARRRLRGQYRQEREILDPVPAASAPTLSLSASRASRCPALSRSNGM